MARIYCDKLRNYRNIGIIIRIPTNYENGFFYDISRSTIVEQVLDMSALDRLESRRRRKGNREAAGGEKKVRVEIAPGAYGTKVVGEGETAAQEPQETLNMRQTKQSLKEY